jgi:hypothetical protein
MYASKRVVIASLSLILPCVFALATFGGDASLKFKLPLYDDLIVVSANFGDKGHLCIIDSGFSMNAVDKALCANLGGPLGQRSVVAPNGEKFDSELFAPPTAILVTYQLPQGQAVLGFDMTAVRQGTGHNVECIIGMPLFRAATIRLDRENEQLQIWPKAIEPAPDWGRLVSVAYSDSGMPMIPVTLGDGVDIPCGLDTGCTTSFVLSTEVFSTLVDKGQITLAEDSVFGQANGERHGRTGRLSKVRVGGFETKNVFVLDGGKACVCGLRYLRRFCVTFDLTRDRIYLAKSRSFDAPERESIGMHMLRKNGRTVVVSVDNNSVAEKAGILANDEVLSLSGLAVSDDPIAKIHWAISDSLDSSGAAKLVVRRDGSERPIVIGHVN